MRIIVTGGNSGVGMATAAALAVDGHSVVIACRSLPKAERAAAEMVGDVDVRHLDLADLASVHRFADSVETVDALVNNAGVMGLPLTRTAEGSKHPRRRSMRTLMSALGALVSAGALVSGCGVPGGTDKPVVSRGALQTDIADRLTKAGEQPTSVTCKEDLVGEVGKTARCEVVISSTNSFEPVVTVSRVDGSTIDYEMTPALSKEQLEKAVSRLVTAAAGVQVDSVSCDSGLEGNVGATAHCDVAAGGVKLRRTVEVTSVEGLMMNFDVVPMLMKVEVESSLLSEFERLGGRRPDFAECSGNLEGKPGNAVDCTVVRGAETAAFTLTVTTVEGSKINYRYEPKA